MEYRRPFGLLGNRHTDDSIASFAGESAAFCVYQRPRIRTLLSVRWVSSTFRMHPQSLRAVVSALVKWKTTAFSVWLMALLGAAIPLSAWCGPPAATPTTFPRGGELL